MRDCFYSEGDASSAQSECVLENDQSNNGFESALPANLEDLFRQINPVVKIRWLGPVEADAQFANLMFVLWRSDTRERNHLDSRQGGLEPDSLQYSRAVMFGKVEVQNNHTRFRFHRYRLLLDKANRLFSIPQNFQLVRLIMLVQGEPQQVNIRRVILND